MKKLNIKQISEKLGRYVVKVGNTFTIKGDFLGFAEMVIFIEDLHDLILANYKLDKFKITYTLAGCKPVTKDFKRYTEAHEAPSLTAQDLPGARYNDNAEKEKY